MEQADERYETLRWFILNSGSPTRGARMLLSFETEMQAKDEPGNAGIELRDLAKRCFDAVLNDPSPLANHEQLEFCLKTKEEMEKLRAMYDAGWLTPSEEGFAAFDPKARPVDWDGKANPYPSGSVEYDEWQDGYSNAIDNAMSELGDELEATRAEALAEDEKRVMSDSLERFFNHTIEIAPHHSLEFEKVAFVNFQISLLAASLMMLGVHVKRKLPAELKNELQNLAEELLSESQNHDIERICTFEDRLEDFKNLIARVQALGEIIAERQIKTKYGMIEADLYRFSWIMQHKGHLEYLKRQQKKSKAGTNRSFSKRKKK